MKATVSEKGQLTIPKKVRETLGIKAGQVLDVREEAGRLVATKAAPLNSPQQAYGILKLDRRTDQLIESMRGKPDAV